MNQSVFPGDLSIGPTGPVKKSRLYVKLRSAALGPIAMFGLYSESTHCWDILAVKFQDCHLLHDYLLHWHSLSDLEIGGIYLYGGIFAVSSAGLLWGCVVAAHKLVRVVRYYLDTVDDPLSKESRI